jgi:thiol-disulfide isomerase/thioredoxin
MKTAHKIQILGILILIAALAGGVMAGLKRAVTVPAVTFIGVKGDHLALSSLRGKVVLVNFWATTCAVCLREMPKIAETHEKYRARGYETIAVAVSYDRPDWVFAYAVRTKLPFPIALDLQGMAERAFGGIKGTPTSYLVDRQGRIVRRFEGAPDFAELRGLIEKELARKT